MISGDSIKHGIMKVFVTTFLFFLTLMTSCTKNAEVCVEVKNPLSKSRSNEMIELEAADITNRLHLTDGQGFVISDAKHLEIPYQLTHDHKVIFLVDLKGKEILNLKLHPGTPSAPEKVTCGQVYPQRFDDLAWENDLVGFRAYGPALQERGEKAFGYDLFAKRGTHKPVLESMYAMETDKIAWSEIRALREFDPQAAEELRRSVTYHVDKGHGMDCYAVGPTLGAGVAALLENNKIVYPWCYKKCEILDNGPLRFTARLTFTPIKINGQEVVETRILSLDAGSHFNKTRISYTNLNQTTPIVTGIVLHNTEGSMTCNLEKGYMSYEDPTTGPNQGFLYLGHVFPNKVENMGATYFSPAEMKQRNNAKGHILAKSTLTPNTEFCYYWGFGWNKSDILDYELWISYLDDFSERLRNPLQVTLK